MIGDQFLDSGAHGLYDEHIINEDGKGRGPEFFESREFFGYAMRYADFLKKNHKRYELYANLDVIFDARTTWNMQNYLEGHGLSPVPVVHFDKTLSNLSWLEKYLKRGHMTIAFGGLGQAVSKTRYLHSAWGKEAFALVRKLAPNTKIHGFAMTSPALLNAHPWDSVDSTSWLRAASYGSLRIPRTKDGRDDHSSSPAIVGVSAAKYEERRYIIEDVYDGRVLVRAYSANKRAREWCEANGIDYRESQEHYGERIRAGIIYFDQLTKAQGTKFYFSGNAKRGYRPQDVLDVAHLMPSYKDIHDHGKDIACP